MLPHEGLDFNAKTGIVWKSLKTLSYGITEVEDRDMAIAELRVGR
jgi:hypothetical protein